MSIYYKYAPDGTKIVVVYYVYDCLYWCTYEALVKCFVGTLVKKFHVKLLGYVYWFMSIRISNMNYHSISVDQARYANSIAAKYLDTDIVKVSTIFFQYHFSIWYDLRQS